MSIKNSVSNDFDLRSSMVLTFSTATCQVCYYVLNNLPKGKRYIVLICFLSR